MFGLYPAGPMWVRRFISTISAAEVRERLVEVASFTAGTLLEPFGKDRGAVIASHQGFLVMVDTDLSANDLVVVPDIQLQNLLWSMSSGFASQWSNREIRLLTGLGDWDELIKDTSRKFELISKIVQQAVDGRLIKAASADGVAASQPQGVSEYCEDGSWAPVDYDNLVPVQEWDSSCVH